MISNLELSRLQRSVQRWYSRHARDLPWRRTPDPYAIMVSEFMLQQTTVTAVIPYYHAWMRRFPTIQSLARADEQEVLRAWEGLGYYSRARNLRAAAQKIAGDFRGEFPRTAADLMRLPGVGRYTAAAILTFAFNEPVGIVEANTTRLLARLFDVNEPVDHISAREQLWKHANEIVPEKNAGQFNSALMDLGALVCVSKQPRCLSCPVQSFCRAQDPELLPRRKPRPAIKKLVERHSFACRRGRILLQPCEQRWRGMWMLPMLGESRPGRATYSAIFAFTHHRIRLEVFSNSSLRPSRQRSWFKLNALEALPIPNPHRRALRALLEGVSAAPAP